MKLKSLYNPIARFVEQISGVTKLKRRAIKVVLSFFLTVIFIACNEQNHNLQLGEIEQSFDEQLVSISQENDSVSWIGSAEGDVWRISAHTKQHFDISDDRIYKVVVQPLPNNDTLCWIGIRNKGLQKWQLSQGKLHYISSYPIPFKGVNYSVYDIISTQNKLLVATSNGLFCLPFNSEGNALQRLYPTKTDPSCMGPKVIRKLAQYNNTTVVAASQSGLLVIDLPTNHVSALHAQQDVKYIHIKNDTLYTLLNHSLVKEDIKGQVFKNVSLDFSPAVYTQIDNNHYLIGNKTIAISKDLDNFITIPLRRKVPTLCSNILTIGAKNGFMTLVTENALWRIPHHLSVFNDNGAITTACSDENNSYFINAQNEVYCRKNNELSAKKIYTLPASETVLQLHSNHKQLFYTTANNSVKTISLSSSYIKNQLFVRPSTLYQSCAKITTSYLFSDDKQTKLYLGVQDSAFIIDPKGTVEPLNNFQNKYVIAFLSKDNNAHLYIATLNNGVFYGTNNKFVPINSNDSTGALRDFIVTDEHNPRFIGATNRLVFMQNSNEQKHVKGIKKLLYVNDTLFYAVLNNGILPFTRKGNSLKVHHVLYPDIQFEAAACNVSKQQLQLGSAIGVLLLDAETGDNAKWLYFDSSVPSMRILLIIAAFALLTLVSAVIIIKNRGQNSAELNLESKEILLQRLKDLEAMFDLLERSDRGNIQQLRNDLDAITLSARKANKQLTAVSQRIMQLTRNTAMLLPKKLQSQINQIATINACERNTLTLESQNALASDNLETIRDQVQKNQPWIQQTMAIIETLTLYKGTMARVAPINGITTEVQNDITLTEKALIKEPLSTTLGYFKQLSEHYEWLMGAESLPALVDYLDGLFVRLNDLSPQSNIVTAIEKELKEIELTLKDTDREQVLVNIKRITKVIEQLEELKKLSNSMENYVTIRQYVIQNNKEKAVPKQAFQLENEVAQRASNEVEAIKESVNKVLKGLEQTDIYIVHDVLNLNRKDSQTAQVLALLLANAKVKRTLIAGMLGLYGNFNPVISRLINGKLKPNREQLIEYIQHTPATLVQGILALIDKSEA